MRLILTGVFAFSLTAATAGFAEAQTTQTVAIVPAATTATVKAIDEKAAPDVPVSAQEAAAARARLLAAEAAMAPQAGADSAMWNDGAPVAESQPGAEATETTAETAAATKIVRKTAINRFADRILSRTSDIAMNLTRNALRFIGVPYVFGGTSARGFDCSGFVQHVYAMLGRPLPRTADAQYLVGKAVAKGMLPGDLVFFQTYAAGASHVGIYLGDGKFVHSSSSHGVTVSRLSESYWSARYLGAKRVL